MSKKTRKRIGPVSLVMSLAIIGALAAFLVLVTNPGASQAQPAPPADPRCEGADAATLAFLASLGIVCPEEMPPPPPPRRRPCSRRSRRPCSRRRRRPCSRRSRRVTAPVEAAASPAEKTLKFLREGRRTLRLRPTLTASRRKRSSLPGTLRPMAAAPGNIGSTYRRTVARRGMPWNRTSAIPGTSTPTCWPIKRSPIESLPTTNMESAQCLTMTLAPLQIRGCQRDRPG